MLATLRVLPHLVSIHIRTHMQYRGALVLAWFAQAVGYAGTYAAIALIITRFENLGGWTWPQMALLLAIHLLAYALGASLSFVQFRDMEEKVRLGTFDALLTKPISPWVFLAFSGLNIEYGGHIALAIGLMIWALMNLSIDWSVGTAIYFGAAIVSSAMLTASILTMIGATAIVWVRSRHLFAIYFGFWELARYPLNIFPLPLQALMLTFAPLAFLAYIPAAVLLGKPVPILDDLAPVATLIAGPVAALIASTHWRWSIRNYQGAGG
ncbi:ABC-2 type transport system permease protein [Devosia lucknowensis]|uniref:ABC-2 type transport system permease protein n=1 Tax=Devosia lucknowensis TaxID=1096929 RepID=A0A1Y6FFQ5_9HYPH|nr:ABC-2 family transporter protein [Devosia lucknowensis]SMQ71253.1 ABC-2 type transport system permease protein [Devosia lucknowensis]